MFTGLIEEIGEIKSIKRSGNSMVLEIAAKNILTDTKIGDSIAVNGICLTVTTLDHNSFTVDVMPETMGKTSLGELKIGSTVNLELAMLANKRFGGHFISGHIDGIAILVDKKQLDNAIYFTFKFDSTLGNYIIQKGSIAIDGISLTIVKVSKELLTVSVIPHTLKNTSLATKRIGQIVNIEVDMIGKYIEKILLNYLNQKTNNNSSITEDYLRQNGF
ncbi:MAG: riboflavin synthase [Vulcanibacillus sp.]